MAQNPFMDAIIEGARRQQEQRKAAQDAFFRMQELGIQQGNLDVSRRREDRESIEAKQRQNQLERQFDAEQKDKEFMRNKDLATLSSDNKIDILRPGEPVPAGKVPLQVGKHIVVPVSPEEQAQRSQQSWNSLHAGDASKLFNDAIAEHERIKNTTGKDMPIKWFLQAQAVEKGMDKLSFTDPPSLDRLQYYKDQIDADPKLSGLSPYDKAKHVMGLLGGTEGQEGKTTSLDRALALDSQKKKEAGIAGDYANQAILFAHSKRKPGTNMSEQDLNMNARQWLQDNVKDPIMRGSASNLLGGQLSQERPPSAGLLDILQGLGGMQQPTGQGLQTVVDPGANQ